MFTHANAINAYTAQTPDTSGALRHEKVLHMVRNSRTAGSIPKWDYAPIDSDLEGAQASGFADVLNHVSAADAASTIQPAAGGIAPDGAAHAYKTAAKTAAPDEQREQQHFGFGDILDTINPLHHIPVLGEAYRNLTGDTISRASKMMGSTLFGGPIGAASGLIDLVIEEETGRDMGAHAMSFAGVSDRVSNRVSGDVSTRISAADAQAPQEYNTPQREYTNADQGYEHDLPAALLRFSA